MNRNIMLLALLAALAGCGVDGPPVAPQATEPAVSLSGEAQAGVVLR